MARKSPAFSFYPDSWVLGTISMSFEMQGLYLRMLCYQWAHGPSNANAYANACGLAYETHMRTLLQTKFKTDGELFWNQRLEDERKKQSNRSDKAKTSAKQRWDTNTDANAMRTHMQNGCERITKTHANAMPSVSDSVSSVGNTDPPTELKPEIPQTTKTKKPTSDFHLEAEVLLNAYSEATGIKTLHTSNRIVMAVNRLNEKQFRDEWRNALERFKQSKYCMRMKFSVDWFLKEDQVVKLIEGAYDDRPDGKPKQESIYRQITAAELGAGIP